MKLVVISPEEDHPREREVLAGLLAAGLERYHLRKPAWTRARMEAWLREQPVEARSKIVLHQHHDLSAELGLGGIHWRDNDEASAPRERIANLITSRSCHDLATLRRALGHFDSVFIGPIFPSVSKAGYGPDSDELNSAVRRLLAERDEREHHTRVLALGGITPARVPEVRAMGFDGLAVIGAVWNAADPLHAFAELQDSLCCHAA